ncbi:type 1 glutamine amidotransferase domain-containing protein [Haliangium sp.]
MYKLELTACVLTTLITLSGCTGDDAGVDSRPRALLVVSNHGELGDTGVKTGVWMAELTHPYWALADADLDFDIDIASPDGGDAPIDAFSVRFDFDEFLATGNPASGDPGNDRFLESDQTRHLVATHTETVTDQDGASAEVTYHRFVDTLPLSELDVEDYDVIYIAGGNGAMWQLPDHAELHRFIRDTYESGRIVAAACHGSSALLNTTLSDGSYLVEGKRVTGFSTAEEVYLGQDQIMPLLIQETFDDRGADYVEAAPWAANVIVDGRLITGQNPPSAEGVGAAMVAAVRAQRGLD